VPESLGGLVQTRVVVTSILPWTALEYGQIVCAVSIRACARPRGWATRAAGYRAAISCFGTKLPNRDVRPIGRDRG
jgi:hypothetical protein